MGGAITPLLRPLTTPKRKDRLFAALRRAVLKPKAMDARKNAWISETTWRLVNERLSAHRDPARGQPLIRRLVHAIAAILKGYRRQRMEEVGEEVERLLGSDPPLHQEAWHWMKGWYWFAVDFAPLPAQATLERITAKRVDLYSYVTPLGENTLYPLRPTRWMTQYLRRTRLSGR